MNVLDITVEEFNTLDNTGDYETYNVPGTKVIAPSKVITNGINSCFKVMERYLMVNETILLDIESGKVFGDYLYVYPELKIPVTTANSIKQFYTSIFPKVKLSEEAINGELVETADISELTTETILTEQNHIVAIVDGVTYLKFTDHLYLKLTARLISKLVTLADGEVLESEYLDITKHNDYEVRFGLNTKYEILLLESYKNGEV